MISNLFREAVEIAGSQAKLGEALGIPQQHVSAYLKVTKNSKRKPPDEVIIKLAKYLGMNIAQLIRDTKEELEPEKAYLWDFLVNGAPDQIRTGDPRLRRLMLVNIIIYKDKLVKEMQKTLLLQAINYNLAA